MPTSTLELARELVRRPSVTPDDAGCQDLLAGHLRPLGFRTRSMPFGEVRNLWARRGNEAPLFVFLGHTDVVPPGPEEAWSTPPFDPVLRNGYLHGRGAADMKGSLAAMVTACARFTARRPEPRGSIAFLVTSDEEGPAVNGTARVLDWMRENGETIDACIVGEPTSAEVLGDMAKIGRRGSLTGTLVVHGIQGHAAYPQRADNPLSRMVRMLAPLAEEQLDQGSVHFPPTTVAIASIDTGNTATNVIPARARATFNIRFNDLHTDRSLEAWLREIFDEPGGRYELETSCSSNAFVTEPGPLSEDLSAAVEAVTGRTPELSTTGGTSDARFIRAWCPVIEFGGVGATMHKVDENVPVADIPALSRIYELFLTRYFARAPG